MKHYYFSIPSILALIFQPLLLLLSYSSVAQANPFGLQSLIGTTVYSAPTFADLDNDGDQDMLSGVGQGQFYYFENTGTSTAPLFATGINNYFSLDVGSGSKPVFVDLDNDGDFDIMSGESMGNFYYYENVGSSTNPSFGSLSVNPFGLVDAGTGTSPAFVDLDDDGDLDLLVEGLGNGLSYFENTGTSSAPAFGTLQSNPFGLTGTSHISIATLDIENDGDFDVFLGNSSGEIDLYENVGTASAPLFEQASYNPFGDSDVGFDANVGAVDLYANGSTDLMVGDRVGDFTFFEITVSTLPTGFLPVVENSFNLTDITTSDNGSSPTLVDLDNDNDLDIMAGTFSTGFYYFENVGSSTSPDYASYVNNPFNLTSAAFALVPDFADMDNDGDFDLMAGGNVGNFFYMENTGTASSPVYAAAQSNPFGLAKINSRASVVLIDLDNDNDFDLLAGDAASGDITYFENTGTVSSPVFSTGQLNPFGLEENGFTSSILTAVDMDGDADLDLIIGSFSSRYLYIENIGSISSPEFATPRPFQSFDFGRPSPSIADLDNDGDLDILSGSFTGDFYYFQNATIFTNNAPVFVTSGSVKVFPENSTDEIIDINANDGDGGAEDAGLTYSIYPDADGDLFSVDMVTGELSFVSPPDYETPLNSSGSFYSVTVQADDGLPVDNTTVMTFSILVTDVSEPVIWLGNTVNWNDPANWSTGVVPDENEDVTIPSTSNDPIINTEGHALNILIVEDAVTLTIDAGYGLAIYGETTMNGSGTVTISRNVTGGGGYSMLGSPMSNKKVEDFNADYLYRYNEVNNEYEPPFAGSFITGGYFVSYDEPNPVLTFSGDPNSSQIVTNLLSRGSAENGTADGYNLVANPFPGALDRATLVSSNTNAMTGAIWLWNDGGSNVGNSRSGDYVAVSNAGVTSSDPNITITTSTPLGTMQGFFVKAVADLRSLIFNPSAQTKGGNSDDTFFRTSKTNSQENSVKLSLSGTGELSDLYNDLIVTLRSDATLGNDFALDAEKFSGNKYISFYSVNSGKKYSILALPPTIHDETEVSLGGYLALPGNYQIKVQDLDLYTEHLNVFLIDLKNGKVYDLNHESLISFSVNQEGAIDGRFLITFSPSALLVIGEPESNPLSISGDNRHLTIGAAHDKNIVQVMDLNGKMIFSEEVLFYNGFADIEVATRKGQVYIVNVGEETIKFILK